MGLKEKPQNGKLGVIVNEIRENEKDPEKMKLKEYIAYALGNLSYGSIAKMGSDYLNYFYLSIGLDSVQSASVISATKIWDSINDPIAATIIDNGKGKHGRFKPYLAPLVPVLAVLSVIMFLKPPFGTDRLTPMLVWCFFSYALWETVNTFSSVAFGAIGTVMSSDSQERTLYSTIGSIGNKLSGMVPGIIPVVYDLTVKKGLIKSYNYYTICAVLFAAIGCVAGLYTKNLKERIAPPKKQEHFWENFVTFFQNKNLILLWSTTLSALVSNASNGGLFYIHSLNSFSLQALQWTIAGIPHFLATTLSPSLLKRFKPTRIIVMTNLLSAACYFALYFIVKPIGYATPLGIGLMIALTALAWIPVGISDVAKNILQLNTFDYTAAKTGKRAEATSLVVTSMLSKWVFAAATMLGGVALKLIGFKPDIKGEPVTQTPETKSGLFFMFSIFPAVGSLLSTIPILFFKLEGKEFEQRMAELNERNAAVAELERTVAE
ncbi:MAG: MFS transporter [Oscillospiraceae bacterium]|nr:MFS transporter [Oscillospiraceae bacterium]